MSVGLRFSLGPLVAYVPLTGRKPGRTAAGGQAVLAGVKGLAWLYVGALIFAFFVLAWPYLLARHLGAQKGASTGAAVGVGLLGVVAWWVVVLLIDALT
ncbi:hypothetical protein ACFY19_20810 [Streptosporangium saharense]|uniref:hypothetical protein n=1 Tax=Streptosporangium saharense TaxID=1706840 RepID=UPI0036B5CF61